MSPEARATSNTHMRIYRHLLLCAGIVLLVPMLAMASAPQTQKPKATAKAAAKAATHSTSGIVRSVDAGTLVIAKNDKATKTDTFVLSSTTVKKGDVAVGAKVSVRYTTEGGQNLATAVTASGKTKGKNFPVR